MTAADLAAVEPSLRFDDTTAGEEVVHVLVGPSGEHVVLVKMSGSGTVFCIAATFDGAVTYGSAPDVSSVDSIDECNKRGW